MPEFYTWAILLINQQDEIGEKQLSVFGSRGGQNSPLMHIPLCDFSGGGGLDPLSPPLDPPMYMISSIILINQNN